MPRRMRGGAWAQRFPAKSSETPGATGTSTAMVAARGSPVTAWHGRKSKTKLFHGYKRHIGVDLDTTLVIACAVTPANRPEEEAAPTLKADIDRQQRAIAAWYCDRGYIASPVISDIIDAGGEVVCATAPSRALPARSNRSISARMSSSIRRRATAASCATSARPRPSGPQRS